MIGSKWPTLRTNYDMHDVGRRWCLEFWIIVWPLTCLSGVSFTIFFSPARVFNPYMEYHQYQSNKGFLFVASVYLIVSLFIFFCCEVDITFLFFFFFFCIYHHFSTHTHKIIYLHFILIYEYLVIFNVNSIYKREIKGRVVH